jgi:hypothetical protein
MRVAGTWRQAIAVSVSRNSMEKLDSVVPEQMRAVFASRKLWFLVRKSVVFIGVCFHILVYKT